MTRLRAGAATDVGLARANNQDQFMVAAPIFAVADGMGGHAAGEVASRTAVDALKEAFEAGVGSPLAVLEAAEAANRAVWAQAQASTELRGMGTTLTAIALVRADGADVIAVINVGDSRTYRLRGGVLEQMTVDHSYVAELLAGGQISEAEAEVHPQRHVLTRALGVTPDVDVDLLVLTPQPGDRYLLCSDGLSREVTDAQVASVLRRLADPGECARELVTEAKLHGGNDNITVVVVDLAGDEADPGGFDDGVPTMAIPIAGAAGEVTAGPAARAARPSASPARAGGEGAGAVAVAGVDLTTAVRHSDLSPPAPPPLVVPPRPDAGRPAPGRRERRRVTRAAEVPRARLVTMRVVVFAVLLLAIVVIAAAGTEYYARNTYFVGVRSGQLTIFQGRPGGVLWWKPTIAAETGVPVSAVDAYHLPALVAGVQESSVAAGRAYVGRLQAEKAAASPQPAPAPTSTGGSP